MRTSIIAVAAEKKPFAIVAKHGKGIEGLVMADLLQSCTISIDDIHIKRVSPFVLLVTAEDYAPVGQEVRRPVGCPKW